MKNFKLILILVLALFLRINYDIFTSGYNYDELAIISVAKQSFPFGIIKTASNIDYHAPLYQLIIHFFTYFTPEWLYIRLFNVLIAIINIYYFYKIGTLIKNKNTGYILALILTVNHLAISSVSFIKFYCLIFLFLTISIYYFAKILKYDKGYYKLGFINLFLILTGTYSLIPAIIEYCILFTTKRNKEIYKSAFIALLAILLYLPILIKQFMLNSSNILPSHISQAGFSFVIFYNILNDYFAPLLNYCCNLVTISSYTILLKFIESVQNNSIIYNYLIEFVTLSLVPVAIGVIYTLISFKNNIVRKVGYIGLLFLLVFVVFTKLELTGIVSIYLYPFFIVLLICMGFGIGEKYNLKITKILFFIYLLINLGISNVYNPKSRGVENSRIFYCFEKYINTHNDKNYIATYGGRFLKLYYKNKNIFEFDDDKMSAKFQKEYFSLIFGKELAKKINKNNAFELLSDKIKNNYRNKDFENYFKENVVNKINHNETIVLAFPSEDETAFIADLSNNTDKYFSKKYNSSMIKPTIRDSLNKDKEYITASELGKIIESYSYKYLIELVEKYFTRIKFEQYTRNDNDDWIKIFEDYSNNYSTEYLATNASRGWIFVTYKKE